MKQNYTAGLSMVDDCWREWLNVSDISALDIVDMTHAPAE